MKDRPPCHKQVAIEIDSRMVEVDAGIDYRLRTLKQIESLTIW